MYFIKVVLTILLLLITPFCNQIATNPEPITETPSQMQEPQVAPTEELTSGPSPSKKNCSFRKNMAHLYHTWPYVLGRFKGELKSRQYSKTMPRTLNSENLAFKYFNNTFNKR